MHNSTVIQQFLYNNDNGQWELQWYYTDRFNISYKNGIWNAPTAIWIIIN